MITKIILIFVIAALLTLVISLLRIEFYAYLKIIREHATPYQLTTVNTSMEEAKLILYGNNKYFLTKNFGSDNSVTILTQPNVSYLTHMQQSIHKPFITRVLRLMGSSAELSEMILHVHSWDANGQELYIPIDVQKYIKVSDIQNIVDIPLDIIINANTCIYTTLKGNSQIEWNIFYNTMEYEKVLVSVYKYFLSFFRGKKSKFKIQNSLTDIKTFQANDSCYFRFEKNKI